MRSHSVRIDGWKHSAAFSTSFAAGFLFIILSAHVYIWLNYTSDGKITDSTRETRQRQIRMIFPEEGCMYRGGKHHIHIVSNRLQIHVLILTFFSHSMGNTGDPATLSYTQCIHSVQCLTHTLTHKHQNISKSQNFYRELRMHSAHSFYLLAASYNNSHTVRSD